MLALVLTSPAYFGVPDSDIPDHSFTKGQAEGSIEPDVRLVEL